MSKKINNILFGIFSLSLLDSLITTFNSQKDKYFFMGLELTKNQEIVRLIILTLILGYLIWKSNKK